MTGTRKEVYRKSKKRYTALKRRSMGYRVHNPPANPPTNPPANPPTNPPANPPANPFADASLSSLIFSYLPTKDNNLRLLTKGIGPRLLYVEKDNFDEISRICNERGILDVKKLKIKYKPQKFLEFFTALGHNNLRTLNVSKCKVDNIRSEDFPSLEILSLHNVNLSILSGKWSNLKQLDCGKNKLTVLDGDDFPVLNILICDKNRLQKLNGIWRKLTCAILTANQMSGTLDGNSFPEIKELSFSQNRISELSGVWRNLITLACQSNDIGTLDGKNFPGLVKLSCFPIPVSLLTGKWKSLMHLITLYDPFDENNFPVLIHEDIGEDIGEDVEIID
jgi:hypothetical protein